MKSKAERPYRSLSKAQKEAEIYGSLREPPIACVRCEVQVLPFEMLRHLQACAGKREPHPLSRWITWAEVVSMGVAVRTMRRWRRSDLVQTKRINGTRRYLERDVAKLLSMEGTNGRRKR